VTDDELEEIERDFLETKQMDGVSAFALLAEVKRLRAADERAEKAEAEVERLRAAALERDRHLQVLLSDDDDS
jgi:hypothetical protein